MRTEAVNLRTQPHDIYIGRPRSGQPWGFGNPFIVGVDGIRGECVTKFKNWLLSGDPQSCPDATPERRQWMLDNLHTLKGKRLGCFCKPNACHGDVLAALAEHQPLIS